MAPFDATDFPQPLVDPAVVTRREDPRRFQLATPLEDASPSGTEGLVLLAHADEDRRRGLAAQLVGSGLTVAEVEDGKELLDYFDERGPWLALPRPDVIVTELEMPGWGGLDAARALRAYGDETPIVFINAALSPRLELAAELPHSCCLDSDRELTELWSAVSTALKVTQH